MAVFKYLLLTALLYNIFQQANSQTASTLFLENKQENKSLKGIERKFAEETVSDGTDQLLEANRPMQQFSRTILPKLSYVMDELATPREILRNKDSNNANIQLQKDLKNRKSTDQDAIHFEPVMENSREKRAFLFSVILNRQGHVWPNLNHVPYTTQKPTQAQEAHSLIDTKRNLVTANSDGNSIDEDYQIRPISFTPVEPLNPPTITSPPVDHGKDFEKAISTAFRFDSSPMSVAKRTPSRCTFAVSSCCNPGSELVDENCFEEMDCRGPFWDRSPCSFPIYNAAMNKIIRYRKLSHLK